MRRSGGDAAGSATLSGYGGDFRGVYLNPDLCDGDFRQYAVLPLDLFGADGGPEGATPASRPGAAAGLSSASPGGASSPSLTAEEARTTLLEPLLADLSPLGISLELEAISGGELRVVYSGPPKARRAVQFALMSDKRVAAVTFTEAVSVAAGPQRGGASPAVPAPAVPARFEGAGGRFSSRPVAETASDHESLHTQGWVVLPAAHFVEPALVEAVRSSTYEPIFNGHAAGEEPLRLMGREWSWASELEGAFGRVLANAGLLRASDGSDKVVNDCYALLSLPCCGAPSEGARRADGESAERPSAEQAADAAAAGRQPAHSDAPEPADGALAELHDDDVPLSALLAIQPRTCLWVFPDGCPGTGGDGGVLLSLDEGDMLVWRGDLVHAGAGYAETHYRIHAYVDPPPERYRRPRGKTNRCGAGAPLP